MPKKPDAPETTEPMTGEQAIEQLKRWELPAVAPDDDGFYQGADWIRIECDWPGLTPRDGAKPLWVEIDASLTFEEAEAIPNPFEAPFGHLYPHVCPRVRAWNYRRIDRETGTMVPVSPPAEAGPDAFRYVRPRTLVWLAYTLKTLHLGGGPNRGKETSASGDGSSGANDGA